MCESNPWAGSYKLTDLYLWQDFLGPSFDGDEVVSTNLTIPVQARWVMFNPREPLPGNHLCMRIDIRSCQNGKLLISIKLNYTHLSHLCRQTTVVTVRAHCQRRSKFSSKQVPEHRDTCNTILSCRTIVWCRSCNVPVQRLWRKTALSSSNLKVTSKRAGTCKKSCCITS